MASTALSYPDLVTFGVKASAERGISPVEVQRAFVRAMRDAYPHGEALEAAATSGFIALMAREGGSVSAAEAAALYGRKSAVSPEALRKAAKNGNVIGLQDGLGEWMFPVWQFGERGGVLPGLRETLAILRDGHPAYDDLLPITFFLNPSSQLGGKSPLQALREHDIEPVLQLARASKE